MSAAEEAPGQPRRGVLRPVTHEAPERLLPQNVEAEAALLGCALIHPGAYEATQYIRPKHFYREAHRTIWQAYEDYYQREAEAPDLTLLCDELERRRVLEDMGGRGFVGSLVNSVGNWMLAPSYAKIVFRQWRLRSLIDYAGRVAGMAYDEPDADLAFARAEELLRATATEAASDSYLPVLDDERAEEMDPADGILGDLLYEDSLAILYGQSGRWKSFVALSMALSIATGLPWLGRMPQPGHVVYVAAEGGGGLGKRITAWKREHGILPGSKTRLKVLLVPVQLLEEGQVEKFVASVRAVLPDDTPSLVVLDTLSRSMAGGDENAGKDGSRAIEQADKIRRAFGCCVLIVAHPGKDDTRGIRGWSGYFGAAHTVMKLASTHANPHLEVGETIRLISEKPKEGEAFADIPLTTRRHEWTMPSTGRVVSSLAIVPGDAAELETGRDLDNLPVKAAETLALLRAAPNGLNSAQWQKLAPVARGHFYRLQKQWQLEGVIRLREDGRYVCT